LLAELKPEDLGEAEEVILSAGGSAYFDLVIKSFHEIEFFLPSGWYSKRLLPPHDSRMYREQQDQRITRGWQGAIC
jgi:hypothetical protein